MPDNLFVHWLWSERAGVFSLETALQLHQLSDALPSRVYMTLPLSWAKRRLRVPEVLRLSYEQRLKNAALATNRTLVRERQVLLFERFLVRASAAEPVELVVKGGMAIELRTVHARTTKDIDVRAMGDPARFEAKLAQQAREGLGDLERMVKTCR